jgi:sigma-B regulation protein RsbU (phosphoserine phosphatase)
MDLEVVSDWITVERNRENRVRKWISAAVWAVVCGVLVIAVQPTAAQARSPRERAARPPSASAAPPGPVLDATGLGGPMLLDQDWRVGISADPGVAQPGFDDSSWAIRSASQVIAGVPELEDNREGQGRRYAWFRLHIRLAAHHGPVGLLLQVPVARSNTIVSGSTEPGVTVFANGQRIQPDGLHAAQPWHYQEVTRLYDLRVPADETSLTLVARTIYIPFGMSAYTSFFASHTLRLGQPQDLQHYVQLWTHRNLFERLPRLVYSVLLIVLAFFLLALYFAQRGHNEYLWLALHEITMAPVGFVELAGSSGRLDSLWYAALVLQLMFASAYLFFEFLVSFLALRRRWYIQALRYTAPILGAVGPVLLMVGHGHNAVVGATLVVVMLGSLIWMLGWLVFTFSTLVAATIRRNFEAGLLLVPLVLSLMGSAEPAVTSGMGELTGRPYLSPFTVQAGPIPIHLASIADFTGVLAIVIIIFLRFLRVQREQQHATSELAAARSVQELMIPQDKVETPGFEVDSVYSPANEVGGDFYHVETMGDDGVLVVIGDVAGKGLKAAMSVSMIMGALRRTADQSPARILESLNRVLMGGESFTTCQAAWFGSDGELVLANAGHLPPYLNSQEVVLPGGLPLGVIADVSYEETRLYLHPGDRVLLLSDGVVEARRPSGELFGFDRVHNLSNQTAFTIADTARTFGQVDDITVLTVRRLARPAAAERTPRLKEIRTAAAEAD